MKTPNTQLIQDDVLSRFEGVRAGAWSCRRIAGTLTWSQHAYTEEAYGYEGNAVDLFPTSMSQGDGIAEYVRDVYPQLAAHVLWRVKNHFDHVHVDTWPQGYGLPPCKGGDLRVVHRDLSAGRTFHTEVAPTPPPPPPSIDIDLVPVTASSNPQVIGLLQERINQTFYKDGEGLTIESPPRYGNGTASAVKKWLVPLTGDTDPDVQAGKKVNFRQWNELEVRWHKARV